MPGSLSRYNIIDTALSGFGPKEDFLKHINSSGKEFINRILPMNKFRRIL
jgi:hypothetical protein